MGIILSELARTTPSAHTDTRIHARAIICNKMHVNATENFGYANFPNYENVQKHRKTCNNKSRWANDASSCSAIISPQMQCIRRRIFCCGLLCTRSRVVLIKKAHVTMACNMTMELCVCARDTKMIIMMMVHCESFVHVYWSATQCMVRVPASHLVAECNSFDPCLGFQLELELTWWFLMQNYLIYFINEFPQQLIKFTSFVMPHARCIFIFVSLPFESKKFRPRLHVNGALELGTQIKMVTFSLISPPGTNGTVSVDSSRQPNRNITKCMALSWRVHVSI